MLLIVTILIQSASLPAGIPEGSLRVPVYDGALWLIGRVAGKSEIGWIIIHTLLVFAQGLYLNSVVLKNRLLSQASFTPAFLYLVYTAASPEYRGVPPSLIANFFIIGALDAMLQFGQPTQPRRQIFNAGFLIGVAAFAQFSYIFGFLLLIMALLLLRPFHAGEYVSALIGLLTPVYFMAGILFLMNQLPVLLQWPLLNINMPDRYGSTLHYGLIILGFAVLCIAGIYQLQNLMNRSTIYIRRAWGVVVSGGIAAMIMAIFADTEARANWLAVAPFFALIAASALETEKPRWFATFAFWLALIMVVLCRFFLS